jgi:hypothetical protein
MINGRFIKTGRIESADGITYFDLDNGEIGGNIKFLSSDGTNKNLSDLNDETNNIKNYIDNDLYNILNGFQEQIDGQIEQYFYEYDPDHTTLPTSNWVTNADKEIHLGDLFYNTATGNVFRWIRQNLSAPDNPIPNWYYYWQQLQDNDLAQALALANEALALAGTKCRIFTNTPYTPYDVGDLWVQGTAGDIMRCKIARASGSYSASDWERASRYTDDAKANEANEAAEAAQEAAAQAQADATLAKVVTDNFTSINGGLILTTLIKMLTNGVETGGVSANLDNILLWGGGTYAQALQNIANIILRHDGSGQLLGGKFKFTQDNKLIVNLDNFKISDNGSIYVYGGVADPFFNITNSNYQQYITVDSFGYANLDFTKVGFKIRMIESIPDLIGSRIYLPGDTKYDGVEFTFYNTASVADGNYGLSGSICYKKLEEISSVSDLNSTVSPNINKGRMVKLRCYCFKQSDYISLSGGLSNGYYVRWIIIEDKTF